MKVVCLLSGGLDSTTLLAKLLSEGHQVRCLSVFYGQLHERELEAAQTVAVYYGVEHRILSLPKWLLAGSALTGGPDVPLEHYSEPSQRLTVVPNRNAIFIMLAAGWAMANGDDAVAYGAHADDRHTYWDCRPVFDDRIGDVLSLAEPKSMKVLTPLLNDTKTDIVRRAMNLMVPISKTYTCYSGRQRHCGQCGSCRSRKEAFVAAGVPDPTEYEGGAG
jgi:7-cyano-7-deazaguanine synthase